MKKYLPVILILFTLVGLFSSAGQILAQAEPQGSCIVFVAATQEYQVDPTIKNATDCPVEIGTWSENAIQRPPAEGQSEFKDQIDKYQCGLLGDKNLYPGCFIQAFYGIFYVIPSFLLFVSAYFFNVLISLTLGSELFSKSTFILEAWTVVRDLSNIFFILILLYIAIKVILGFGGHHVQGMIAQVIIMALLINFSMFFTKVVIDTANIIALIFYNKIEVESKVEGVKRPYSGIAGEKDVAGGMVTAFDPTNLLNSEFFEQSRHTKINGVDLRSDNTPPGVLIGISVITGVLMLFVAYAFFVSGLMFVGRLIELWVLIIFSPFAFMSSTVPQLSKYDHIGWGPWLKKLVDSAFMAPIFMFFMYFIFLVVQISPFKGIMEPDQSMAETILLVVIPAVVILVLLMKATSFAKKGGGKFGEVAMTGAKALMGVGLGVATGGTALAARAAIGGGGGYVANKLASGANYIGDSKWGNRLGFNKVASGLTSVGAFAQKSSFDARGIKIGGKTLGGITGLNMGEAQKGGIAQARKEKVEQKMKKAEGLKVREDEGLKQGLNKTEQDLQSLLVENANVIKTLDEDIEKKREEIAVATSKLNAVRGTPAEPAAQTALSDANTALRLSKENKKDFREGKDYMMEDSSGALTLNKGTGAKNFKALETQKKYQAQAIKVENARRTTAFANRQSNWRHWGAANREAKHKIIMESKIESKGEAH